MVLKGPVDFFFWHPPPRLWGPGPMEIKAGGGGAVSSGFLSPSQLCKRDFQNKCLIRYNFFCWCIVSLLFYLIHVLQMQVPRAPSVIAGGMAVMALTANGYPFLAFFAHSMVAIDTSVQKEHMRGTDAIPPVWWVVCNTTPHLRWYLNDVKTWLSDFWALRAARRGGESEIAEIDFPPFRILGV